MNPQAVLEAALRIADAARIMAEATVVLLDAAREQNSAMTENVGTPAEQAMPDAELTTAGPPAYEGPRVFGKGGTPSGQGVSSTLSSGDGPVCLGDAPRK